MTDRAFEGDPRVTYTDPADGSPPDVPALIYPDRIPDNGAYVVVDVGNGFITELAVHNFDGRRRSSPYPSCDEAIEALIGAPQVVAS